MPPSKKAPRRLLSASRPAPEPVEDDDDEVEAPAPPARRGPKGAVKDDDANIRGGWGAGQANMDATSTFAQAFKVEDAAQAIKFLEDKPYANWRRHWVETTGRDGSKMNRSYTCLGSVEKDCPVCDAGDRAQAVSSFNVALLADDGEVLLKSWDVGPRIFQTLKGYANDPKIGPLTKGYFLVSKTGKKGTVAYNINPVRGSSLFEDYDIEEPEEHKLDRIGRYDVSIIEVPSVKDMKELALQLSDYDD